MSRTQLWVEKYRPTRIDDLASQEEVTKTLRGAIAQGQLPHLVMYGPPGTGKTSTILAVARTLYHPSVLKDRVLEMNASDERGIKIVRDKIKNFASHSVSSQKFDGYPSPPFKIIILDECDKMLEAVDMRRDVQEIFKGTPHEKQVMMFSAPLSDEMRAVCKKFMQDPLELYVDDSKLTLHGLQQHYVKLDEKEKNRKLNELLDALEFNQVVVFVKSVQRAIQLDKLL